MRFTKFGLCFGSVLAAIGLTVVAPVSSSSAESPAGTTYQPAQSPSAQPLIVGGRPASETYPFMVSLQTSGGHACGGSLISAQWVATAKHCVGNLSRARVGTTTWNSGGTLVGIASQHHTSPDGRDFALVQLAQPVQQQPIPIAADGGADGTATRLIGWGQTCPSPGCGPAPSQLQEIDVRVLASGCTDNFDPSSELCLGDRQGTGACYGDSGGPSVREVAGRWELTGATSRAGRGQPNCGEAPAIYMNVTTYQQWIDQVTGGVQHAGA